MTDRPEDGPKVSVLTPSYNQVRWLPDNLESVAMQTYPWVEHIVMDGGSGDGSADLLAQRNDPGLVWESRPDDGQSDALNRAFARSTGEIIGWLNSDDAYFTADTVAWVVAAFAAEPSADVIYGHAALVNASGNVLQVLWAPGSAQSRMSTHNFLVQPTVFVRRRVLGDLLVDPAYDFMMDWELWLRLARKTRFLRVDRILALDRHQPNRKVIAQQDLGAAEGERLRRQYDLRSGPTVSAHRKLLKISYRLIGATRVREVQRSRLAFRGRSAAGSLLLRQLAVPRSRMSFEG